MKQFISLMKALSDPNRVKIVKMLQRGQRCVCEIQPALGLAQPTVSSHLKVLEHAGIVQGFRQGQWMHYSLTEGETPVARAMLEHMRTWLEDDPEIAGMLAGLRDGNPGTSGDRPCRNP